MEAQVFSSTGGASEVSEGIVKALYTEIKYVEVWNLPVRRKEDHDNFLATIGDKNTL